MLLRGKTVSPVVLCGKTVYPVVLCSKTGNPVVLCGKTVNPVVLCGKTVYPVVLCCKTLDPVLFCGNSLTSALLCNKPLIPIVLCGETHNPVQQPAPLQPCRHDGRRQGLQLHVRMSFMSLCQCVVRMVQSWRSGPCQRYYSRAQAVHQILPSIFSVQYTQTHQQHAVKQSASPLALAHAMGLHVLWVDSMYCTVHDLGVTVQTPPTELC